MFECVSRNSTRRQPTEKCVFGLWFMMKLYEINVEFRLVCSLFHWNKVIKLFLGSFATRGYFFFSNFSLVFFFTALFCFLRKQNFLHRHSYLWNYLQNFHSNHGCTAWYCTELLQMYHHHNAHTKKPSSQVAYKWGVTASASRAKKEATWRTLKLQPTNYTIWLPKYKKKHLPFWMHSINSLRFVFMMIFFRFFCFCLLFYYCIVFLSFFMIKAQNKKFASEEAA